MRFSFPLLPAEFEIPDDWWSEAGMLKFTRGSSAYRSTAATTHSLALREVEPPFRFPEYSKDFRGFDRARMIHILARIAAGAEIDPVPVLILPALADISKAPFRYRVLDGVHRFYASVAAGFEQLPAVARVCFQ
jgi:hypothetical protein